MKKPIPYIVKALVAINPRASENNSHLTYPSLKPLIDKYTANNNGREDEFWDSENDSLNEEIAALRLASYYLLKTSEKLNEPYNNEQSIQSIWASRFTEASIEIYGAPDPEVARTALYNEYALLQDARGDDNFSQADVELLLSVYLPIFNQYNYDVKKEKDTEVYRQFGEEMQKRYQGLFDVLDRYKERNFDKEMFLPSDLIVIFTECVEWLKENDDNEWNEWTVKEYENKSMSVNSVDKEIKIPLKRSPASYETVKGLIAHEILVHAMRCKNGSQTDVQDFGTGFPKYDEAEEGLGILAENSVNGLFTEKGRDRYIDIALALGILDGKQRTRHELFEICFARKLIAKQMKGTVDDDTMTEIAQDTWAYLERIYRGGPGNERSEAQAIFTKDMIYYSGQTKIYDYIMEQLKLGVSMERIYDYIMSGKFDPTNQRHVKELKKHGISI